MAKRRKQTNKNTRAFDQAYREPAMLMRQSGQVMTAVMNDDAGTPRRAAKAKPVDDSVNPVEGGEIGGLGPTYITENGRPRRVTQTRDILDVMLANGTIDTETYRCGRDLQAVIDWMEKSPIPMVNYGQGNGGGTGPDMALYVQRRTAARVAFEEAIAFVGGVRSAAAHALVCMIGGGWSLNDMVREKSQSPHYWRGVLLTSLNVLVANWKRRAWWEG